MSTRRERRRREEADEREVGSETDVIRHRDRGRIWGKAHTQQHHAHMSHKQSRYMQQSEVPISFSFPPANRQTAVLNCAWYRYLLAAKEFPVPRSRAGCEQ